MEGDRDRDRQDPSGWRTKKWIGSRNSPTIWGEARRRRKRAAKGERRARTKRSKRDAVRLPSASCALLRVLDRLFFLFSRQELEVGRSVGRPASIRRFLDGVRLPSAEAAWCYFDTRKVSVTVTFRWEHCSGCRHSMKCSYFYRRLW